MQEGIYQLTYSIEGSQRRPNRYIGVIAVGDVTMAVHLRREEDGTFVTRRYDLVPQRKIIAMALPDLNPDNLWKAGVINSCESPQKVDASLDKVVGEVCAESRRLM